MKSCTGLILILLGLFVKATTGENSTQVYYIELQIEAEAYDNFTNLLKNLILNVDDSAKGGNNSATVQNISITTECNSLNTGGKVNCSCKPGYSWSEDVCKNHTECCKKNNCMLAAPNPRAMCLSDKTVHVSGSFIVSGVFTSSLSQRSTTDYKDFVSNKMFQLESVYSTLLWFDSLTITRLRQGSVIGDFEMLLTAPSPLNISQLEATTKKKNISGTFNLIVTGFINIYKNPPQEPVPYKNVASITCSTPKFIGNPVWSFQQNAQPSQFITNGIEATVIYNSQNSTVSIKHATEVWQGTFTCDYKSSNYNIIYRASLYLDIALVPQIIIMSFPQFPSCTGTEKQFSVKVWCIVPNTTEEYTVTWTGNSITADTQVFLQNDQIAYQAYEGIFCDENLEEYNITCQFTNRQNQTKTATLTIPIIKANSTVCSPDNGWQMAKANATAIKLCNSNTVGLQKRKCMGPKGKLQGNWGPIISECVNRDLRDLVHDAMNLQRGLGIVEKNAPGIFGRLKNSTEKTISTFANVNASVVILETIQDASKTQNSSWNLTVFPDFVKSSSNLLNDNLNESWVPVGSNDSYSLAPKFLNALEGIIKQTNPTAADRDDMSKLKQDNIQMIINNKSVPQILSSKLDVIVTEISSVVSVQTVIKNLASKLPNTLNDKETVPSGVILSVIVNENQNKTSKYLQMKFNQTRLPNHEMFCVYWDNNTSRWSTEGCTWGGADDPNLCKCEHLSAFTILMAKDPITLIYMEELTKAGLSFSIASLTLGLVIEFLVWNAVVKSPIAHFRHTVLVNIMICLLIADCSFLAVPVPSSNTSNWCLSLTVMKHFCFLASFFWMLCMSLGLLHQVIFVFAHLRKKVYLGLCFFLGYVCPLIIVTVTFITYNNGEVGYYYSTETCWLRFEAVLKGSIHAFVFPVFVIVFVNMFTMVVVISRILKPTLSEGSSQDEKEVARSIVKTVVLLTPVLGTTWVLGLFMLMLDLTKKPYAQIVYYAFTFFNSFQGFFILLTECLGVKKVREALLKCIRPQKSVNYQSESSARLTSEIKKK